MRSLQDLLSARRALVDEQRSERDPDARLILEFSIQEIDREVQRRMFEAQS